MKVIPLNPYYDEFNKLYLHPRWQRKRLEILSRDDFRCTKCGCEELPLHVHHDFYEWGLMPWDYPDESLRTVCEWCHDDLHDRRLAA